MVLMIFQKNAFKEVVLQSMIDDAHRVLVDKKLFNVQKSFYLDLSMKDNQWSIRSTGAYELIYHHKICESIKIESCQIINIQTSSGDLLKCITCDSRVQLASYEKYDICKVNEITVGKNIENTIQYDFLNIISQTHFKLVRENKGFVLYDLSSNGIYVNHKKVNSAYVLKYGDLVEVFGLKLVYLDDVLALASVLNNHTVSQALHSIVNPATDVTAPSYKSTEKLFNRSPRIFPAISKEQIVISQPNAPQFSKKRSLFMTIGPSFTMAIPMLIGCGLAIFSTTLNGGTSSAFMFTGIITAVGAAVLGSFWAFMNIREAQKNEIAEETQRFNSYGNYLVETAEYIKEKYRLNSASMHAVYPSSKECCEYNENSSELWNRNATHEDFLFCRLGLGDVDFQVDIKIPQDRFFANNDLLRDKPAMLYDNFKVLKDVPVGVNLKESNLYGIVGGKNKKGVYRVVNNIIAQLTANNSYTDVKIAFCYDKEKEHDKSAWEYIKWFPHIWSENRKFRYYATNKQEVADVFFEISNVLRSRAEEKNEYTGTKQDYKPYYILFLSDSSLIEGELISKYIYDKHNNYGLTTVILTDFYQNLPNICEDIIENDDDFCGSYNVYRNTREAVPIHFDKVTDEELLVFAKKLSAIKVSDVENDTGIPDTLSFLDMYGVDSLDGLNILERWRNNRTYDSMKALVGKKVGGASVYLDAHEKYHGPHGLVAGTTGSGKSELIQTFMLSLAINYSPDDISFFVIDFKGGGMANLFSDLPHMAGQISNLSGNQISRAMISIKSENLRRQKLFSDYGVNNINNYTRLYKNGETAIAIPHLFIIIDEFAELKKEEPDFMRELISVAQVGRSLGVHLVLATQKPSGTVDENIWSNSKFKLCLRVQDRQDSNDMLHKPDAAYITQAGRCYLQVGNDEVYELFQSGYSGAVFEESADRNQDIATIITPTGKTAIIGSLTKMKRKEKEKCNWFKFLLTEISKCYSDSSFAFDTDYEFAQFIIRTAQKQGYNIGDSPLEICAMQNYISIAAKNTEPTKENIDLIVKRALKNNKRLPELKDKTQLEAIVKYIYELSKRENYKCRSQLWMPLLKINISLDEISKEAAVRDDYADTEKGALECIVGLYDDPQNQAQLPFKLNFTDGGHLAVCGCVVSGKSTFLQTMIFSLAVKYSPSYINFYLLDFSSGMLSVFEQLPHVGGVIKENDVDRTEKFFNLISVEMEYRKALFKGGNYNQYVRAFNADIPLIMIVIDNYASFREKTENKYEDMLLRLTREGVGYGIYMVVSAAGFGISEIPSRIADNFRTVVSLEMSDKFKYMDVLRTTRVDVLPESGIKGRGIAYIDSRLLEFQTAIAVKSEDAYKRNRRIEELSADIKSRWTGLCAKAIPFIPENPIYEDIAQLEQYKSCIDSQDKLPVSYKFSDASVYSIDLKRTYCYCISGKKRTGKTNVLKIVMAAALKKKIDCVVIEKSSNELKALSDRYNAQYLRTDKEIVKYFHELTSDFVARNKFKKELEVSGVDDNVIFEKMQQYKQIFIFVADIPEFIQGLYNHDNSIGNMSAFFENIFEKGMLHNIYFFGCINSDNTSLVSAYKAYQLFVSYKTGMHLGGNVASQRIFNFQNISYQEISKSMKKGEALVPDAEDDTVAHKIVIPLFGGVGL